MKLNHCTKDFRGARYNMFIYLVLGTVSLGAVFRSSVQGGLTRFGVSKKTEDRANKATKTTKTILHIAYCLYSRRSLEVRFYLSCKRLAQMIPFPTLKLFCLVDIPPGRTITHSSKRARAAKAVLRRYSVLLRLM